MGVRSLELEVGCAKFGVGSWECEVWSWKLGVRSLELEVGCAKFGVGRQKTEVKSFVSLSGVEGDFRSTETEAN